MYALWLEVEEEGRCGVFDWVQFFYIQIFLLSLSLASPFFNNPLRQLLGYP